MRPCKVSCVNFTGCKIYLSIALKARLSHMLARILHELPISYESCKGLDLVVQSPLSLLSVQKRRKVIFPLPFKRFLKTFHVHRFHGIIYFVQRFYGRDQRYGFDIPSRPKREVRISWAKRQCGLVGEISKKHHVVGREQVELTVKW